MAQFHNLSKKTIANQRTVLNQIFEYAIFENDIIYNPCSSVPIPVNSKPGKHRSAATHKDEDSNGLCDVCEYQLPISNGGNGNETPDIPDEPKDGLPTGAIVGIAVGGVAVAGIGGFALVWFVVKKKTWAEFLAIFKKK